MQIDYVSFWVKSFAFAVMTVSVFFLLVITGPAIETTWFPVVSKLHIDKIEPINDKSSRVWVSYVKFRDCEYFATTWYSIAADGGSERVGMDITPRRPGELAITRPLGLNRVGPWTVDMPADKIRNESLIEVFHRCTLLWMTKSQFYP